MLVPVGIEQVRVIGVELLGKQLVLLSALVAEIVAIVASEEYLTVIMNVTPNLEHILGNMISRQIFVFSIYEKLIRFSLCTSFLMTQFLLTNIRDVGVETDKTVIPQVLIIFLYIPTAL